MPLPDKWATIEDFAKFFHYSWHRECPISQIATGVKRTDWTMHIGIIVRSIADLMGLFIRFESGGRKEAVLGSSDSDEIAIEWEWGGVRGNELGKLKNHKVWSKDKTKQRLLKYAVFISCTHAPKVVDVYNRVTEKWKGAEWPLLLIFVDLEESKKFSTHKEFKSIRISKFDLEGRRTLLRDAHL